VSGLGILLVLFVVFYVPLVGWMYGRQGRWIGAAGWVLITGGLLLAFGGGGDLFPWAGLLWAFVALFGVLLLAMDIAILRQRRR
jgi:hypothetical protein